MIKIDILKSMRKEECIYWFYDVFLELGERMIRLPRIAYDTGREFYLIGIYLI